MINLINLRFALNGPAGVASDLGPVITNIIKLVIPVSGIILLGLLIYGGYTWMTSLGDAQKIKTAQGILVSAIIGIGIVTLSGLIVTVFAKVIGFNDWFFFII